MKLLMIIAIWSSTLLANDGFFQGAGTTLFPVNQPNLRVIREELDITPIEKPDCFEILYQGKKPESYKERLPETALAELSKKKCRGTGGVSRDSFTTQFHAKVKYEVEAKEDVKNVQMGFPVPTWSYEWESSDGLESVSAPGAVNFETTLDERPLPLTGIKWVELAGEDKGKKTPAFIWNASFEKGKKIILTSEYDFGGYHTATFFKEFLPTDALAWWDESSAVEKAYGNGGPGVASHVTYYLTPLKQWGGPPPEKVRVRFHRAKKTPIFYYLPNTNGLRCIDKDQLYFEWTNAVPKEDLKISFPEKTPRAKIFKTQAQFMAWAHLIGSSNHETNSTYMGTVKVTCDLIDEVIQKLGPKSYAASWFPKGAERKCVPAC